MPITAGEICVGIDSDHIESKMPSDLSELTSPDTAADWLVIEDVSANTLKKIKIDNLGAGGGGGTASIYAARIAQTGTSNPTATVGQNDLGGTVVWTRVSTGLYRGTLTGAWAGTCIPLVTYDWGGAADVAFADAFSDDVLQVITRNFSGGAVDLDGGIISLYVLVYP